MQRIAAPVPTAQHAGTIELVAATEDGGAAVSQDHQGGTRVWPTLDGRHEPVVVAMNRAIALTIARTRTAQGFVIAAVDEAGGAEVIALDDAGRIRSRRRLPPEPAIESIRARGDELLVVRADQTIDILTPDGNVRSRLAAPAGRRILGVVTRGARALAMLDEGLVVRGAWITEGSWGPSTAQLITANADFAGAALSPSGTQLAVPQNGSVAILDLATAHVDTRYLVGADRVEFIDDVRFAAFQGTRLQILRVDSDASAQATEVGTSPVLIGERVLSGVGDQLELCIPAHLALSLRGVGPRVDVELVPADKEYLGYRIVTPVGARVSAHGALVTGGLQAVVELDRDLHARRTTALPDDLRRLVDAIPLDSRYVLASHAYAEGQYSISVIDTQNRLTLEMLSSAVPTQHLGYMAATELLAVIGNDGSYLLRRDPSTSRFDTWFRVGAQGTEVRVLDPASSGGVVALTMKRDPEGDHVRVGRIYADQLVVGSEISPRESFLYEGRVLGVDAHGRAYVASGGALVGFDGDRERVRIAKAVVGTADAARVIANDDHVVLVDGPRVAMWDDDGVAEWDVDATSVRDVGWMGDELVAQFDGGLAKLDLADGHIMGATCGWAFGLSDTPHMGAPAEETICEAP